jgi:hypothetical protein
MLREHQKRQQIKKKEIEKKKQEALLAANEFTHHLINHLNDGYIIFFSLFAVHI